MHFIAVEAYYLIVNLINGFQHLNKVITKVKNIYLIVCHIVAHRILFYISLEHLVNATRYSLSYQIFLIVHEFTMNIKQSKMWFGHVYVINYCSTSYKPQSTTKHFKL